jgi:ethanolamine utilization protein EutN
MFLGRVVGVVWSTVKWKPLEGLRLVVVRPYRREDLAAGGEAGPTGPDGVVAGDLLGAGVGEDVIVAFGHAARVGLQPEIDAGALPALPVDAAVVAIVDRFAVDAQALATGAALVATDADGEV